MNKMQRRGRWQGGSRLASNIACYLALFGRTWACRGVVTCLRARRVAATGQSPCQCASPAPVRVGALPDCAPPRQLISHQFRPFLAPRRPTFWWCTPKRPPTNHVIQPHVQRRQHLRPMERRRPSGKVCRNKVGSAHTIRSTQVSCGGERRYRQSSFLRRNACRSHPGVRAGPAAAAS